jgi:hypothetical protein
VLGQVDRIVEIKDGQAVSYRGNYDAYLKQNAQATTAGMNNFVSKDIEADPGAKEELLNKNGGNFQGVPVTDINGELVLGFDRPKLQDLLRKNGLLAD